METALICTGVTVSSLLFIPFVVSFFKNNAEVLLILMLLAAGYFLIVPEFGATVLTEVKQLPQQLADMIR